MQVYLPSASGAPLAGAAPRARSPIGAWQKVPVAVDDDPATAALAARLQGVAPFLAIDHAAGVLHRLYRWVARLPGQPGHVRDIAPATLAMATRWGGDPGDLVDALREAGVIDSAGQVRHLAYVTGHLDADALRREGERTRKARYRANVKAQGTVEKAAPMGQLVDIGGTCPTSSPRACKERGRITRAPVEPRHTHTGAVASKGPPPAAVTVAGASPVPPAVEVVRATLAFDPSPPAVVAIVETVGGAPADLAAWRDACRQWARGRTADGRPWAVGDGAVGAILDRFRQVRARRASPLVSVASPVASGGGTPPPTPVAPRVERSPEAWARNDVARAMAREVFRAARPAVTVSPGRPIPARVAPIAPPVAGRVPVPLAGTRTATPERLGAVLAAMWTRR
jgi:hypothetical protein